MAIEIVSIPSNRGYVSDIHPVITKEPVAQSQSPQIGAMFRTDLIMAKIWAQIKSQSPQIGAMFRTHSAPSQHSAHARSQSPQIGAMFRTNHGTRTDDV